MEQLFKEAWCAICGRDGGFIDINADGSNVVCPICVDEVASAEMAAAMASTLAD